jgi:major membrane immunogen (membrane-anchored lipoprotein)
MKKFSLVVVLLLALLLVGCGNKSVDNDSDVVVK